MNFGLPIDLLDTLELHLKSLISWSPFVYIVGFTLVSLFVVEIFGMLRRVMFNLKINSGLNAAVDFGNGQRIFGKGKDVDNGLLWAGYKRVGTVTHVENWAAYDDDGQQVGDTVKREFYEHIKK